MKRGLKAPLSAHEEAALRRIALGISKAKHSPARYMAHLISLCLVKETAGRLMLTDLGRERYQRLSNGAGMSDFHKDVAAAAALRLRILQARGH